jgi:2-dehydropantoate 2-reductase
MRIGIAGAGGVGGLLAGLLARGGHEVHLVARGAALEAVRARGVSVDSPLGAFTARVAAASDDPAALGPCDAVIVAVKAWQVEALAPRLAPMIAPGGVAVPLQNGVLAPDQLARGLGDARAAAGIMNVLAWLVGPGAVKHAGPRLEIVMGERGERARAPSARLEALAAALRAVGCAVTVTEDAEAAVWQKAALIEPWGAVCAAARAPVGVVRTLPETRGLLLAAQAELLAVARARGVRVAPDAREKALAILDSVPPESTASMHRDLAAGRPSELEDQVGAIVRLARDAGVAAPVQEALHAALLPMERAARGAIPAFQRT